MEFDPLNNSPNNPSFDNGFEKLESLGGNQEELVSSTQTPDDDIYNPSTDQPPVDEPLIDMGHTKKEDVGKEDTFSLMSDTKVTEEVSPFPEFVASTVLENVDPRATDTTTALGEGGHVIDLLTWKDPRKTGVVFGSLLVLLVSLACFSLLSVLANIGLALLTVSITFVLYKKVMAAVQKTDAGHPFKHLLEMDLSLSSERVHEISDKVFANACCAVNVMKRLFLIEDIIDSLKLGLALWVLTYVGAWFDGYTMLIIDLIALFTLPKVYVTYQQQIDDALKTFAARVNEVMTQIKSKIPFGNKKKEE